MLGTSNLENAPTATVDAVVLGGEPAVEERRASTRTPEELSVQLTGMGCAESHRCTAKDISEGGLYIQAPAEYGLQVGQRCAVGFVQGTHLPELSCLVGEICYATVVRTEQRMVGTDLMVGAGLRFDQPLFF